MKLWTVQPLNALEELKNFGSFACDPRLSGGYVELELAAAYDWLVEQMDARHIIHPEGLKLPLWAWHTRDWKRSIDLNDIGLDTPGKRCACIEFEIEDSQVLLSDCNAWHYVINKMWFEDSRCEEEFDANMAWFDAQPISVQNHLMVESWQKIFNVAPYRSDWHSIGMYVQATFWKLREDMIRNVEIFTAK